MSGDVQPRKRKDKKKKKDELGVEEPRGTAAALGEGDVFIHSQQDHGTGGHWCAKIIFFSLLAVLITLIGLIILENRGLTELEANAVESRYSGVLEGWIEDAPDDDHHDEHTLDLKHHDDEADEDHNAEESDREDEEDHGDDEDHEDEEDHGDDEDHEDEEEDHDSEEDNIDAKSYDYTGADEDEVDPDESNEEDIEANKDEEENEATNEVDSNEELDDDQSEENLQDDDNEVEEVDYKRYKYIDDDDDDENGDDESDENDADENVDDDKNNENNDQNSNEDEADDDDNDDDDEHYQDDDEGQNDNDEEYNDGHDNRNLDDVDQNDESIEDNNDPYSDDHSKELKNQDDDLSSEIYDDDNDDDENNEQNDDENEDEQDNDSQEDDEDEIEKIEKEIIEENEQDTSKEYQEADDEDDLPAQQDDDDEAPLERITAPPAGKPFVEIEEEIIEKPVNTLAEEEEYEKRQEQLRREEEEAAQGSQMWLKLAVGGALLVATHAVLRRATAPRDIPEPEEHTREETPIIDRRMTIIPEQSCKPRVQESPLTEIAREIEEEIFKKPALVTKSAHIVKQDCEEEVVVKKAPVEEKAPAVNTKGEEKELYSDDEELEDEEEEEDIEEPVKQVVQKKPIPVVEQKPTEDSEPEDVEIIDDEQIEEELEDEENEDEEEISDVDDAELLSRLEAKYGRLPEPERFGRKPDSFEPKHKDGGNSIEDDWPGEPSDAYWRTEINVAEEELRQGEWSSCEHRVSAPALSGSGRARWLAARALDLAAEAKRDNALLSRAIAAYLQLLKMNERLSDKKLLQVAQRAIDRIQFRGTYLSAEPIYRLLIRRFPDDVNYRNNLTVSFLMANRADLAAEVLKETLRLWPNDRVALAHHGFVLKTQNKKLDEAVQALYKALEGDTGPANEPRFYYHLGDALLLLGRPEEAHEVHKRGAALGHFLSPAQRSLYNVPRLRSRPWWPIEETPYVNLARELERSWRDILKEGETAKALYEKEKEGLKERGEWTQLDLFVRGAEIPGRCERAPVTCSVVRREAAAARCRRGQVKFSSMAAGTHVRAHVGPTNCRLRMHLGLSNTNDTYIRVDKETRQWQTGKTFLFDDSFEHEVWHNGSGTRLVLIVDVWHPDLSAHERRTLPAI